MSYFPPTSGSLWPEYVVGSVAELLAALAAASAGETILVLPGTYTLAAYIEIPSGVHLKGSGIDVTVLTGTFAATMVYAQTAVGSTYNIGAVGAYAHSGMTDIWNDAGNLHAGDLIKFNEARDTISEVASDGVPGTGVFTFSPGPWWNIGAAGSVTHYASPNTDVQISDLTIRGDGTFTTQGLYLKGCLRPQVRRVKIEDCVTRGLSITDCVGEVIEDVDLDGNDQQLRAWVSSVGNYRNVRGFGGNSASVQFYFIETGGHQIEALNDQQDGAGDEFQFLTAQRHILRLSSFGGQGINLAANATKNMLIYDSRAGFLDGGAGNQKYGVGP